MRQTVIHFDRDLRRFLGRCLLGALLGVALVYALVGPGAAILAGLVVALLTGAVLRALFGGGGRS